MKPVSLRIRKHIQTVILRFLLPVVIHFRIDRVLFPFLTPFFLDCSVIIYNLCTHAMIPLFHSFHKESLFTLNTQETKRLNSVVPLLFIRFQTSADTSDPFPCPASGCTHSFCNGNSRLCLSMKHHKFSRRTPRPVQSLRCCLSAPGSSLKTIRSYYSSSLSLQYTHSL